MKLRTYEPVLDVGHAEDSQQDENYENPCKRYEDRMVENVSNCNLRRC
jgi:hypothetical protein